MRKILFVDDDEDIRTIAHMSLTAVGGWEVTLASSGHQALAEAAGEVPDLVILDVMMPGMDGPQTLQHLRQNGRLADVPVIFMTAKVQKAEIDHYHALGAGVIAKPFDPMGLPAEVRRVSGALLQGTESAA